MIDAIIFDFDGVIVNSEFLHYKACCKIYDKLQLKVSYDEYTSKYCGLSDAEAFSEILNSKNIEHTGDDILELVNDTKQFYLQLIENSEKLPLIPGIESFILHLTSLDKKLAICTGSSRQEVLVVLDRIQKGRLKSYFNTIVTIDDIKKGKPSPEGYLKTSALISAGNQCLVIEDSPRGIDAAKGAGLNVIALLTTHKKTQLTKADHIVSSFSAILKTKLWLAN